MEAREVYSETTQHWARPSFVLEEISHKPLETKVGKSNQLPYW